MKKDMCILLISESLEKMIEIIIYILQVLMFLVHLKFFLINTIHFLLIFIQLVLLCFYSLINIILIQEQKSKSKSNQSINFTRRLLEINPEKRLGNENGIKELKEHPWFNKFPWEELKNKTLQAPYIPKENNNLKINIPIINNKTPTNISSISTNFEYQKFSGNENEFNDYYFNKNDKKEEKKKINSPKKQINKSKKNNLINLKILRESIKNKIEKYDEIEKENEINKKRITKNTKENKIRINYNYIQLYDNFKNK